MPASAGLSEAGERGPAEGHRNRQVRPEATLLHHRPERWPRRLRHCQQGEHSKILL